MSTVKVIVAYDKSSADNRDLLAAHDANNEIYIPVMGGKALGGIPGIYEDMQGDDTGEGTISELNPYIHEISQIWWAWKNFSEIGNPDFIGLCHYRRIVNAFNWFHGLKPNTINCEIHVQTIRNKNYMNKFDPPMATDCFNLLDTLFPDQASQDYLREFKLKVAWPTNNIFVMPSDEFENFMQFEARVLDLLQPTIEVSRNGVQRIDAAALMFEFINGFYFDHAFNVRGFTYHPMTFSFIQ